jgi:hypothetical protein
LVHSSIAILACWRTYNRAFKLSACFVIVLARCTLFAECFGRFVLVKALRTRLATELTTIILKVTLQAGATVFLESAAVAQIRARTAAHFPAGPLRGALRSACARNADFLTCRRLVLTTGTFFTFIKGTRALDILKFAVSTCLTHSHTVFILVLAFSTFLACGQSFISLEVSG